MNQAVATKAQAQATVALDGGAHTVEQQKTTQMQLAFVRALARAQQRGVRILRGSVIRSDGSLVWRVSSASNPAGWRLVCLTPNDQLVCDCPAGERVGVLCQHRAVVLGRLLAGALAGSAPDARQVVVVPEVPDVRRPRPSLMPSRRSLRHAHLSPRAARRLAADVLLAGPVTATQDAPVTGPVSVTARETTMADRDTAILRRGQKPFSIWAS